MKIHGIKRSPFNCRPSGWLFLAKAQYLSNAETEAATHGRGGQTNLQNTMLNNGLHCPDGCSSKHRWFWHSVESDVRLKVPVDGFLLESKF